MTNTYQETPVYESRSSLPERRWCKGHLLIGLGAFILLVQFIPGNVFLPLALIAAGAYLLRQAGAPLAAPLEGGTLTKGHVLVGLGSFFLAMQVLPGGLVFPLALIALGLYLLRRHP